MSTSPYKKNCIVQSARRICGYRSSLVPFNYRPTTRYTIFPYTTLFRSIQTQNHSLYYCTNMTCVFMILRLAVTVRGVGAYSRAPHTAHETALQKLTSAA